MTKSYTAIPGSFKVEGTSFFSVPCVYCGKRVLRVNRCADGCTSCQQKIYAQRIKEAKERRREEYWSSIKVAPEFFGGKSKKREVSKKSSSRVM